MHGYTKLFESILTSTIWDEDEQTRIVWITMLALKNQHHVVEASLPGLARMARVSMEATKRAIDRFLGPDEHSRSQEFEGRRIEPVDGGWKILNGAKYDGKMKLEERREYMKNYMREYVPPAKRETGQPATVSRFTPPTPEEAAAYADEIKLPQEERLKFLDFYGSKGWKVGKSPMKDWKCAMRNWQRNAGGNGNGGGARSVFELKTVLEAKERMAGQIKDNFASSGALDTTWTDEGKHQEYRKLRGEIKALQQQIAGMA